MYLTIISVFWVCYDQSIRRNVKFIINFRLSLEPKNWNFVDRFLDPQQGPWLAPVDNKLIKWLSTQTISYQGPFLLKQINCNSFMDK